ncbi:MAG: EcsC family protein, partial [Bacteroidales bacterium]|nr:EcsC family protein [Bacteroidales bacterium]
MKNNLPTIENRTIAQRNITTLDKIYNLALNGIGGISEPLGDFVSDYISRYGRTEKAIDKMVSTQKLKLTTSGFVTGLGGLITLPVAIPADLASSLYVEMRMIAAIASLRGYNIYSDQVKTLVYVCMVGNALGDVIKQAGIKTATQLTVKKLLPKLTREIIVKINKA